MGDNTPKPSLWVQEKNKKPETKEVIIESVIPVRSDLRPFYMKKFQDSHKKIQEDFESEPANIDDIANDIVLKSDVMGRVLKGVAMNSRFKTAHEPDGTPLAKEKSEEFEPVKNVDDMGNSRNVSTDPLGQDTTEREDAKMHIPDGKEREAVAEKELTITGKNKLVLTYEEAQKIIEGLLPGVTIEWR